MSDDGKANELTPDEVILSFCINFLKGKLLSEFQCHSYLILRFKLFDLQRFKYQF